MGLGQFPTVTLADARSRANDARRLLFDDIDPIDHRRQRRTQAKLEVAKRVTFVECAGQYIASHQAGWRNPKHRAQWDSTLKTYAHPMLGGLPVAAIDTSLVIKVLQPIWTTKPETASRLRGRIESILELGDCSRFSSRRQSRPVAWSLGESFAASFEGASCCAPCRVLLSGITGFREQRTSPRWQAARALEFAIFTAARTGEVIGARWSKSICETKFWTIPAERMKAGKEHRVPLAPSGCEILEAMKPDQHEARSVCVPWQKTQKPLSNMAFLMLLRRMERSDLTAHGFRSTSAIGALSVRSFPSEVAEMALAHAIGSKVEAAYRRGDLFEKRRQLMDHWATFCTSPAVAKAETAAIIPIREAVA